MIKLNLMAKFWDRVLSNRKTIDAEASFELPFSTRFDPGRFVVSPNNRRVAYVAESVRGEALVHINGEKMGSYSNVSGLTFSRDSSVIAFTARLNNALHVVFRNKTFGPWDDIGRTSPVISPDGNRVAFTARKGQDWYTVLDGEAIFGPCEGFGAGGPVFSNNSNRLLYVIKSGEKWEAIVDGVSQVYCSGWIGQRVGSKLTH